VPPRIFRFRKDAGYDESAGFPIMGGKCADRAKLLRSRRRIEDETSQLIRLIKHQDGESFGEIRWRLKAPISQAFLGPENQVVVILKGLSAIGARKYMHDFATIFFNRAKKMHGVRFADGCLWVLLGAASLRSRGVLAANSPFASLR